MINTEQRSGMMLTDGETAEEVVPKSSTFAETRPKYIFGALPRRGKPSPSHGWTQVSLPKQDGASGKVMAIRLLK